MEHESEPPNKKVRSKEANAESQRRFRERRREQEEAHNAAQIVLVNAKFEELEVAAEENRKLELEHQILLHCLYVREAIFHGYCQSANLKLAPLEEPPLSAKATRVCSIVKDLAILLAIPQTAGPQPSGTGQVEPPALQVPVPAPPAVPSACENVPIVEKEADLGLTSDSTSQCSHAVATETTSSASPPAAPTAARGITVRTVSSGVDTESVAYLNLPQDTVPLSSMEYAPINSLAPTIVASAAAANNISTAAIDILGVVQSIQTADQFLHRHENLVEALRKPSAYVNGTAHRTANDHQVVSSRLHTLHGNLSNLHSLYWHTAQLKPEVCVHAAHKRLPNNTELAVEIASQLVPGFSPEELAEFRKVSRSYEREMNKVSVSVEGWMDRIRGCVVPEQPVPFAAAASVALDIVKCVSQLNVAIGGGIKARREMMKNFKSSLNLDHIEYINSRSYPYMPDHVAVYTLLQELARELHRSRQ